MRCGALFQAFQNPADISDSNLRVPYLNSQILTLNIIVMHLHEG